MRRTTLLLLTLLTFLAVGCQKRTSGENVLEIKYKVSSDELIRIDSPALFLYGKSRVTVIPLDEGKKLYFPFRRDTVDYFLLMDINSGRMVLPIIPDSTDISVTYGKDLKVKGILHSELLETWHRTLLNDTVTPELRAIIQQLEGQRLGDLMLFGAVQRFPKDKELSKSLMRLYADASSTSRIMGWDYSLISEGQRFVYEIGSNKVSDPLHKIFGKDTMMIVGILPTSKVTNQDTLFLNALDTLAQKKYYILPGTDSLPESWYNYFSRKTDNYWTTDNGGKASRLVADMSISDLPTYFIVDSLGDIEYHTVSLDSLLQKLKRDIPKE